jgi:hypothetical protein
MLPVFLHLKCLSFTVQPITLRFYGPNGEERSEEKVISMPYNMLPKGEFEYRISGGYVLDSINSRYDRSEVNLGLNRWFTIGGGTEYLSSIRTNKPYIPFGTFTFQPFKKLIITGEYAHEVRFKSTLNYTFPHNTVLELQYSNYNKNQTAIIYNYLEERVAGLSIPYRINKASGLLKGTFRENIYSNFAYNAAEFFATGHYLNFNANLSNFCNWTSFGWLNIYSNLALGMRVSKGFNMRLNGQYNYSTKSLISYKVELEKQIFKNGLLTVGYENNVLANYNSLNASFKYNFSFISAFASSYFSNSTHIIEVDGHTDNVGNSLFSLTLPDKRAAAVKDYLIKKGVDAKRMSSHGYGDTKPVVDNKTKAGKTLNRRVGFVVTFEETSFE